MTQKQMMEQMMEQMNAMAARIEQLEKGAHKGAPKPKSTVARDHEYVRKDGTVKKCTEKEYNFFMAGRKRAEERASRTPEETARIKAANQQKASDADAAVCRKLEKAFGCKAGSIQHSTITLDEAKALGFKGNRAQLKALKAECRAK